MTIKPASPFFTVKRGPAPKDVRGKYPFLGMKVGQFFDVPRSLDRSVRVQASIQGRKHGRTYSVRRIDNERVRVYRTA